MALAACSLLALACGPRPDGKGAGEGVLVVVIDALRADHVSWYGYDRRTTPYLDTLATEGVAFTQAFSPAPEIVPAHAAILTGGEPMLARRIPLSEPSRGTPSSDWHLPPELPRLPREFLSHGFATAAFADHPAISPVCGFDAGFQEFASFRPQRSGRGRDVGIEGVASRFQNWLSGLDASRSWFAYVHIDDLERLWARPDQQWDSFFEPRAALATVPPVAEHDRVFFAVPRGRWNGGTQSLAQYEARYDGALRNLDRNLGRLFESIRRLGRLSHTTIAVVGAYGVGLGESGVITECGTFSDCDLRVPVIVRPAPALAGAKGVRTAQLFGLTDLAPTLLELHRLPVPAGMHGLSQAGALRGDPGAPRELAFASGGLQGGFAAIDARFCYEESSPGALEQLAASPLSVSWYGDELDHRGEVRAFLHERNVGRAVGHLGPGAQDPEASARLAAAGADHYAWVEKARTVLQAGPRARREFDPELLAELGRRKLLGE